MLVLFEIKPNIMMAGQTKIRVFVRMFFFNESKRSNSEAHSIRGAIGKTNAMFDLN